MPSRLQVREGRRERVIAIHRTMLLSRPRHCKDSAQIYSVGTHGIKKEVQGFHPHERRTVDNERIRSPQSAAHGIVLRQSLLENDRLFINRLSFFKINDDG